MGNQSSKTVDDPSGKLVHSLHRTVSKRSSSVMTIRPTWKLNTLSRLCHRFRSGLAPTAEASLSKEKRNGSMLSEYDKHLIRSSWTVLSINKISLGRNVYRRIFENQPDLKFLFSWSTDIKPEEFDGNPAFNRQAEAITCLIDQCVCNIDDIDGMDGILTKLGRFHLKFREFGLSPEHWVLFKYSVMLSIASTFTLTEHKEEILEAWNTFLTFIIRKMREGFDTNVPQIEAKKSASKNSIPKKY